MLFTLKEVENMNYRTCDQLTDLKTKDTPLEKISWLAKVFCEQSVHIGNREP